MLEFAIPRSLSAEDLKPLQKLSNLKTLILDDCQLEEYALTAIKDITTLEKLDAHNTGLTDTGMNAIRGLKKLKILSIHINPEITDAGMQNLNDMTQLEQVNLARLDISDKGIKFVENNPNLNYLKISETGVSDASLPLLKALKQMTNLYVKKTNLSETGIQELQDAFPSSATVRFD